jgi:hypothetical protein
VPLIASQFQPKLKEAQQPFVNLPIKNFMEISSAVIEFLHM